MTSCELVFHRQQGAALLILVTLIMVVVSTALIQSVSINQQRVERQNATTAALTAAKETLLGYALKQNPPGLLPCPDTDGDGVANLSGVNCTAQLGYLPYKTLQMEELRDAASERLWYAAELGYTRVSAGVNLNSSLTTLLRLNLTQVVAAVVIAPGEPLNNQVRSTSNAIQYLEGVNADGNTTTYALAKSDTNNDQVLGISAREYWATIERRVLHEAGQALMNYLAAPACGQYPWAALNLSPFNSNPGSEQGWLPSGTAQPFAGAVGCPATVALPLWFVPHWRGQIYYAFCGPSGNACLSLSGDLTQTANGLLITPGTPLSGQSRPSAVLANYFESGNNDNNLQFVYQNPRNHSDTFNDMVHVFSP